MPAVYTLGLLAALVTARDAGSWPLSARSKFLIAAFVATFGAWAVFRAVGMQFGNRYVFFMAFFPQVLIAVVAGRILQSLYGESVIQIEAPPLGKRLGAVYLVAFAILLVTAPIVRPNSLRTLWDPREAWTTPLREQIFYHRLESLPQLLGPGDIIMMSDSHDALDVASVTGAKVVAVMFSFTVPDLADRRSAVRQFFSKGTSMQERTTILRRWNANKVLLSGKNLRLEKVMGEAWGAPIFKNTSWILYDTKLKGPVP
jgi:hypothetical protein